MHGRDTKAPRAILRSQTSPSIDHIRGRKQRSNEERAHRLVEVCTHGVARTASVLDTRALVRGRSRSA